MPGVQAWTSSPGAISMGANTAKCLVCGRVMTRHGHSSSGAQRWRCRPCKVTHVGRIDASAKHLEEFVSWLLSGRRQADMPAGAGRFGEGGVASRRIARVLHCACPVCIKLALLAIGYTSALQWFAPAQPLLAAVSFVLLAWARWARVTKERACPSKA